MGEIAILVYWACGCFVFGYEYDRAYCRDAKWAKANIPGLLFLCVVAWPFMVLVEAGSMYWRLRRRA